MGYHTVWIDDPSYSIRERWEWLTGPEQQAFLDFLVSEGFVQATRDEPVQILDAITELRKKGYTVEPA